MRGKGVVHVFVPEKFGITPACAGKRGQSSSFPAPWWDHPRMCGEKNLDPIEHDPWLGSPPHMRGKAVLFDSPQPFRGITPAHAGKRGQSGNCKNADWDHPRTCGEKFYVDEVLPGDTGSPPHMRGKESFEEHGFVIGGITPAHAGKSGQRTGGRNAAEDHPRTCGEK